MARPKSELTGISPKGYSARLTADQAIAFKRLGGSTWLRSMLAEEAAKVKAERENAFKNIESGRSEMRGS